MNYNKLNLTLAAVLLIVLFFIVPANNHFLYDNILSPDTDIGGELSHMSVAERMADRFGGPYGDYMGIATFFDHNHIRDPLLLLPPNGYLMSQHALFKTIEPAEFYYFTGYRSVLVNSPDVRQADWTVYIHDRRPVLVRIKNAQQIDTLLDFYKKYKNSL